MLWACAGHVTRAGCGAVRPSNKPRCVHAAPASPLLRAAARHRGVKGVDVGQTLLRAHGAIPSPVPLLRGTGRGAALPGEAEDAVCPLCAVPVLLGAMGGTWRADTGPSRAAFLSCAFEPSGLTSKKAFPPAVVTYISLLGEVLVLVLIHHTSCGRNGAWGNPALSLPGTGDPTLCCAHRCHPA